MEESTQRFVISGMSCAACSARVEKAAQSVSGVSVATVNLLKNTLDIVFDGTQESIDAVCVAIDKAGYGAEPVQVNSSLSGMQGFAQSGAQASTLQSSADESALMRRLIVSIVFAVPLFYLSMGHMYGWPLPDVLRSHEGMMILALTEFILTIPLVTVNKKYFINGFKGLIHRSPNMDTLVALGSCASLIYSLVGLYRIAFAMGLHDMDMAHAVSMDLYFEGAGLILTLITVGKYFEAKAKGKTTKELSHLLDLAPKTATRISDSGAEEIVPIEMLHVGDAVVVKAGQSIPADGVITDGSATIDESALTGESIPVDKALGDTVTGATLLTSGYITVRVEYVGEDTALSRIIRLVDDATSSKAPVQKLADRISAIFVPVVIGIAVAVFVLWLFLNGFDISKALVHGISVLVISCPCALGLATPTAIMVGTGRGARQGILIKNAAAYEVAHAVKLVAFDKTGTLTTGKPEVSDVVPASQIDVSDLLMLAWGIEAKSDHPLARAICSYAEQQGSDRLPISDFISIPGRGLTGVTEGAIVFAGNRVLMQDSGIDITDLGSQEERLAQEGKTPLYFAWAGKLLGLIAVADKLKPTSSAAMSELHALGIETVMLTGDNVQTAKAIQEACGISDVVAQLLPDEKDAAIQTMQDRVKTAMVGDGINDAVALARADVGIAIGAGTDVALECADIVLSKSDPLDVAACIQLSKKTMRIIKQNLFWALIYNVICIPVAAGCLSWAGIILTPDIAAAAMSLSSICVVTNALRLSTWKPSWVS